jgi:hypothetical protein
MHNILLTGGKIGNEARFNRVRGRMEAAAVGIVTRLVANRLFINAEIR